MTRLPTPGGDDGTWGDILNAYLEVSLNSDGTIKNNAVGTNQIASNAVTNAQLDSSTQASLGKADTAEQVANKDTDGTLAANSDTKYPSQKASKTYADTKLTKATADASGMGVIVHGSDDSVARGTDFAQYTWIGSVQPTNMDTNDVWVDTT